MPAAVVSMGKIFGNVSAAMSTALYPQMVPMDESASMLCARVERGINSMENEMTPLAAISCKGPSAPRGRRNPMSTWPW